MLARTLQSGITPLNRKSRLLAPTEKVNSPSGLRQSCAPLSQVLRS